MPEIGVDFQNAYFFNPEEQKAEFRKIKAYGIHLIRVVLPYAPDPVRLGALFGAAAECEITLIPYFQDLNENVSGGNRGKMRFLSEVEASLRLLRQCASDALNDGDGDLTDAPFPFSFRRTKRKTNGKTENKQKRSSSARAALYPLLRAVEFDIPDAEKILETDEIRKSFHDFLKERYHSVDVMNRLFRSAWRSWADVPFRSPEAKLRLSGSPAESVDFERFITDASMGLLRSIREINARVSASLPCLFRIRAGQTDLRCVDFSRFIAAIEHAEAFDIEVLHDSADPSNAAFRLALFDALLPAGKKLSSSEALASVDAARFSAPTGGATTPGKTSGNAEELARMLQRESLSQWIFRATVSGIEFLFLRNWTNADNLLLTLPGENANLSLSALLQEDSRFRDFLSALLKMRQKHAELLNSFLPDEASVAVYYSENTDLLQQALVREGNRTRPTLFPLPPALPRLSDGNGAAQTECPSRILFPTPHRRALIGWLRLFYEASIPFRLLHEKTLDPGKHNSKLKLLLLCDAPSSSEKEEDAFLHFASDSAATLFSDGENGSYDPFGFRRSADRSFLAEAIGIHMERTNTKSTFPTVPAKRLSIKSGRHRFHPPGVQDANPMSELKKVSTVFLKNSTGILFQRVPYGDGALLLSAFHSGLAFDQGKESEFFDFLRFLLELSSVPAGGLLEMLPEDAEIPSGSPWGASAVLSHGNANGKRLLFLHLPSGTSGDIRGARIRLRLPPCFAGRKTLSELFSGKNINPAQRNAASVFHTGENVDFHFVILSE